MARPWGAGPRRPAAMATEVGYSTELGVQYGENWAFGSAIADTPESSNLAAFLRWSRTGSDSEPTIGELPGWVLEDEQFDNHLTDVQYLLGVGYRMADGLLALGGTVIWQRLDSELWGKSQEVDVDLGMAFRPHETLSFFLGAREFLDERLGETIYEAGAWWQAIEYIGAGVDLNWQDESLEMRAGAEVHVVDNLALRGGYVLGQPAQELGLGLGLLWEGSRLDYGLGRILTGSDKGAMVHSLGLAVQFDDLR